MGLHTDDGVFLLIEFGAAIIYLGADQVLIQLVPGCRGTRLLGDELQESDLLRGIREMPALQHAPELIPSLVKRELVLCSVFYGQFPPPARTRSASYESWIDAAPIARCQSR